MSVKYSLPEIREMWKGYNETDVLDVLKNGVWEWIVLDGKRQSRIDGTAAVKRKLSRVLSFPDFIKKYHSGGC